MRVIDVLGEDVDAGDISKRIISKYSGQAAKDGKIKALWDAISSSEANVDILIKNLELLGHQVIEKKMRMAHNGSKS